MLIQRIVCRQWTCDHQRIYGHRRIAFLRRIGDHQRSAFCQWIRGGIHLWNIIYFLINDGISDSLAVWKAALKTFCTSEAKSWLKLRGDGRQCIFCCSQVLWQCRSLLLQQLTGIELLSWLRWGREQGWRELRPSFWLCKRIFICKKT